MCEEKLYHQLYFDELIQEFATRKDEPVASKEQPFFCEAGNIESDYSWNTAVWD